MKSLFIFFIFALIPDLSWSHPIVSFKYSSSFDEKCNEQVEVSWATEAKDKEKFFKDLWDKESPELLNFVFKKFPGRFTHKKYSATLSACPSAVSYSNPLILNVSRFLKSYVRQGTINPDHVFIVLSFHELMHNWVEDNLFESPLLEKYEAESREVKVHLHLMALEQYVYTTLNRADLLSWIQRKYPSIGGDYARAWQIVNEEGNTAFLRELISKPF